MRREARGEGAKFRVSFVSCHFMAGLQGIERFSFLRIIYVRDDEFSIEI